MTLGLTEVERLAVLAGIRLASDEAERLARELSAVLEEIAVLREVELSGDGDEDGSGGASGLPSSDRAPGPDPPEPSDPPEPLEPLERDLSTLAPDWREGFFVMPPPRAFRDRGEGEDGRVPEARPSDEVP